MKRLTRLRTAAAVLLGSLVLTGCEFSVYSLPLPGGTDTGEDPISVKAEFTNVLDLVPQSSVKVNDVSVGQVTDIELDGETAVVSLELRSSTDLPANAVAEIRQTSLLGEKFVSLDAPERGASAEPLADGDLIPLERTGRNPEVEEVLGALSLVLNGGGVAQLKTIASEINNALEGREDSARSVLGQVREFVTVLDRNRADIVGAIESLNQLAIDVDRQQEDIDLALDELPSALVSLDKQRGDLVRMLRELNELGDVGVRVIRASKSATIESIRQLQPVLSQLADSGDAFVNAFNVFLTYPFVDEVVGRDPQVARNLHMGDYTNLSVELDIDLRGGTTGIPTQLPTLLPTELEPTAVVGAVLQCLQSLSFNSKACQKVRGNVQLLLELREECQKPKNKRITVCTILNQVPGLPLPLGGDVDGNGAGGGLGALGDLLGLPRAPFGAVDQPSTAPPSGRGATVGELASVYDPDLVALLVPALAVPEESR
ncbi:MCE family protein [Nocardioides sp. SYSU DS0663]|uniref:MCE family protein n=1 Tax=Nocardioides sp. SYSU DS0663 TaxID=3416445 RepID=UPI003F4B3B3E